MGIPEVLGQLSRPFNIGKNSHRSGNNNSSRSNSRLGSLHIGSTASLDSLQPRQNALEGFQGRQPQSQNPQEQIIFQHQGLSYTSSTCLDPFESRPEHSSLSGLGFTMSRKNTSSSISIVRTLSNAFNSSSSKFNKNSSAANLSHSNCISRTSVSGGYTCSSRSGAHLVQTSPFEDVHMISSYNNRSGLNLNDPDEDNDSFEIATFGTNDLDFDSDGDPVAHEEDLLPEIDFLYPRNNPTTRQPSANFNNFINGTTTMNDDEGILSLDDFDSSSSLPNVSSPEKPVVSNSLPESALSSPSRQQPAYGICFRENISSPLDKVEGLENIQSNSTEHLNMSQPINIQKHQYYAHPYETGPIDEAEEYDIEFTPPITSPFADEKEDTLTFIDRSMNNANNGSTATNSKHTIERLSIPYDYASLTANYLSGLDAFDSNNAEQSATISPSGSKNSGLNTAITASTPIFTPAFAQTTDSTQSSTSSLQNTSSTTTDNNTSHQRTTSQPEVPVAPGFSFSAGRHYIYSQKGSGMLDSQMPGPVYSQLHTTLRNRVPESSSSLVLPPLPPAPSNSANNASNLTTLEDLSQQMLPDISQDNLTQKQYINAQYAVSSTSLAESVAGQFATPSAASNPYNFDFETNSSSGPLPVLNTQYSNFPFPSKIAVPQITLSHSMASIDKNLASHSLLPALITNLKGSSENSPASAISTRAPINNYSPASIVSINLPGTTSPPPTTSLPLLPVGPSSTATAASESYSERTRRTPTKMYTTLDPVHLGDVVDTNAISNNKNSTIDENQKEKENNINSKDYEPDSLMELHESLHSAHMNSSQSQLDAIGSNSNIYINRSTNSPGVLLPAMGSENDLPRSNIAIKGSSENVQPQLLVPSSSSQNILRKNSSEALKYMFGLKGKKFDEGTQLPNNEPEGLQDKTTDGQLGNLANGQHNAYDVEQQQQQQVIDQQTKSHHDVRYTPRTLGSFVAFKSPNNMIDNDTDNENHEHTEHSEYNNINHESRNESSSRARQHAVSKLESLSLYPSTIVYRSALESPKTLSNSSSSALAMIMPYPNSVPKSFFRRKNNSNSYNDYKDSNHNDTSDNSNKMLILRPPSSKIGTVKPTHNKHNKAKSRDSKKSQGLRKSKSHANLILNENRENNGDEGFGNGNVSNGLLEETPRTPIPKSPTRNELGAPATAGTSGTTGTVGTLRTNTTATATPFTPYTPATTTTPSAGVTPGAYYTPASNSSPRSTPGSSNRFLLEATMRSYRQLYRKDSTEVMNSSRKGGHGHSSGHGKNVSHGGGLTGLNYPSTPISQSTRQAKTPLSNSKSHKSHKSDGSVHSNLANIFSTPRTETLLISQEPQSNNQQSPLSSSSKQPAQSPSASTPASTPALPASSSTPAPGTQSPNMFKQPKKDDSSRKGFLSSIVRRASFRKTPKNGATAQNTTTTATAPNTTTNIPHTATASTTIQLRQARNGHINNNGNNGGAVGNTTSPIQMQL